MLSFASTTARAQTSASEDVEQGRALYLNADFEGAAAAFGRALASASLTAPLAVEAHRHLAALRLALGDEDDASAHAAAAVALDPSTAPPEGAPPELQALLDRARGEAAALTVTSDGAVARDSATTVRARVAPAPDGLFASIRLRCDGGSAGTVESEDSPPETSVRVEVGSDGERLSCAAAASSPGGADLVSVERVFDLRGEVTEAAGGEIASEGGLPLWPFVAGGAAAAVVLVVVIVAVAASSSGNDQAHIGTATVEGW